MNKEELVLELKIILEDFLLPRGFELVELICRYEGRDLVLRILVDKPAGGINLDACAGINRDIGFMLDEKNIIPDGYILEVSSPGLDRLLKIENDFRRCLNKPAKFFLRDFINGKLELDGVISKVEPGNISIDTGAGLIQVPLDKINKAKQII